MAENKLEKYKLWCYILIGPKFFFKNKNWILKRFKFKFDLISTEV
jgi:hypothetical protein